MDPRTGRTNVLQRTHEAKHDPRIAIEIKLGGPQISKMPDNRAATTSKGRKAWRMSGFYITYCFLTIS